MDIIPTLRGLTLKSRFANMNKNIFSKKKISPITFEIVLCEPVFLLNQNFFPTNKNVS
jgi:hypothetical protein